MGLSVYKADGVESARNRDRVESLASLPENKICADCPLHGPRWISINLGAFICLPCSGIHRNLGVHISKMRSVSMDALNDDWMDNMERVGNKRLNLEWQAQVPAGYALPTATDADNQTSVLDRFIRDKYEGKFKKGYLPQAADTRSAAKATGGWGDDNWGSAAPRLGKGPSASAPGVERAPSEEQPTHKPNLASGYYSTGKMVGFGSAGPTEQPSARESGSFFSGFISATISATASVVQSAVPLVRHSVENARPLVGTLSEKLSGLGLSSYTSTLDDAVSFNPSRDLQHLRGEGAQRSGGGGADGQFNGFGGLDNRAEGGVAFAGSGTGGPGAHSLSVAEGGAADEAGWDSRRWSNDEPSEPAPAPAPKPGLLGRLRSGSLGRSDAPPPSRDISDLLQNGEEADHDPPPRAAADEPRVDSAAGGFGSAASLPALERDGGSAGADSEESGWGSPTSSASKKGTQFGGKLKIRKSPAATKVPPTAGRGNDDDDWGEKW